MISLVIRIAKFEDDFTITFLIQVMQCLQLLQV